TTLTPVSASAARTAAGRWSSRVMASSSAASAIVRGRRSPPRRRIAAATCARTIGVTPAYPTTRHCSMPSRKPTAAGASGRSPAGTVARPLDALHLLYYHIVASERVAQFRRRDEACEVVEPLGHGMLHVLLVPHDLQESGDRAVVRQKTEPAAGREHQGNAGDGALQVVDVLQHVHREHEVEGPFEAGTVQVLGGAVAVVDGQSRA